MKAATSPPTRVDAVLALTKWYSLSVGPRRSVARAQAMQQAIETMAAAIPTPTSAARRDLDPRPSSRRSSGQPQWRRNTIMKTSAATIAARLKILEKPHGCSGTAAVMALIATGATSAAASKLPTNTASHATGGPVRRPRRPDARPLSGTSKR